MNIPFDFADIRGWVAKEKEKKGNVRTLCRVTASG